MKERLKASLGRQTHVWRSEPRLARSQQEDDRTTSGGKSEQSRDETEVEPSQRPQRCHTSEAPSFVRDRLLSWFDRPNSRFGACRISMVHTLALSTRSISSHITLLIRFMAPGSLLAPFCLSRAALCVLRNAGKLLCDFGAMQRGAARRQHARCGLTPQALTSRRWKSLRANFLTTSETVPQPAPAPVPLLGFRKGGLQHPVCLICNETRARVTGFAAASGRPLVLEIKERLQPELPPPFPAGFTSLPLR